MNYTDMTKYVLPYCKGCGDAMAIEQLRMASIDFCERSKILRRTQGQATVVGTGTYPITISGLTGFEAYAIVDVLTHKGLVTATAGPAGWPNAVYYDVVSPEEAGQMIADDPEVTIAYLPPSTGIVKQVILNPTPLVVRTLTTVCAVRPLLTSTMVPDDVAIPYIQAIASGALARLRNMAGEPWYDAGAAATHAEDYERRLSRATNNMAMGNSAKPLRVRPR